MPRKPSPGEDRPPRWLDYVDLDELVPDPRNPKDHSIPDLRASLGRFGYTEPVMEDMRTGRLVSGHGRRLLLLDDRASGRPAAEGVVVTEDGRWTVPVVRGWASKDDAEAGAYIVAANRLGELGGWQSDPLAALLEEVAASSAGLDGVGYGRAELDALLESLSDPDPPEDFPSVDPEDLTTEHECPRCHYRWSGNAGAVRDGEVDGAAAQG